MEVNEHEDGRRRRRSYEEAFKRDGVRLVSEEKYTFKAAAAAVNVSEQSLRAWHGKFVPDPTPCGENATLAELKAKNARLRKPLKRAEHGVLREGVAVKYAWITQHRDLYPIVLMCEKLAVSKSGYYASIDLTPSPRAERRQRIHAAVRAVHAESEAIYGSFKIARELVRRDDLESACRNTVARAMRELGLASRVSKAFAPSTTKSDPAKQPAPNVLDRDFAAEKPYQKWVTDITYLPTHAAWVYLAVVLDLFSRKIVGWSMSDSLATPLAAAALRRAIESRRTVLQFRASPPDPRLQKSRSVRSRVRPGPSGVVHSPAAVRKSWAIAPFLRSH